MKTSKLEQYLSEKADIAKRHLLVGLEDAAKIGFSLAKNTAIAGFNTGVYAIRKTPNTIKETSPYGKILYSEILRSLKKPTNIGKAYAPAKEISKILLADCVDSARYGSKRMADALARTWKRTKEVWNDKSNLHKYGLN